MPLLADRVKESTTTQGTGTLTLAGAPPGFRTFTGAFGNGASVYYVIAGPTEWEIGFGTTGAGTLTRDTVLVSSAGGTTKVNLSAGTKDVFCSYVADRAVTTSDAATLTNKTIDDYTNNVGANSTHFRIKAGATLASGDVIKASGFTPGEQAIEVVKTASATDVAIGIVEQALSTGQFGTAVVIGELFNVNTNGLSVGATLYQNGAGGYTTTKPSSGFYQALGWVVRANTSNGVIAVNVVTPLYVEASTNTASTSVLRDGSGNFAAGTITAALSGNASTATALQTARTINGVSFNGTADITVPAAASTLTGTTLASGVTASSLTSVGTLSSLAVSGNASTTNGRFVVANASSAGSTDISLGALSGGAFLNTPTGQPGYLAFNGTAAYSWESNRHRWFNAGSVVATLDASGNLGLGVTPSGWSASWKALQINSQAAFFAGGSTGYLGVNIFNDGTNRYIQIGEATLYEQATGAHKWYTAPSGGAGSAGASITFTQAMTLDANGNLGVGTSNPSAYGAFAVFSAGIGLHANSTSGAAGLNFYEGGSGRFSLRTLNGSAGLSFFDSFNGVERARIDANGYMGVGTASPSHRLQAVVEAGADRDIFQAAVSGASNGFRVRWNHANLKTYVSITDIPTSSAGLPAGTLYSDGGTIKIA